MELIDITQIIKFSAALIFVLALMGGLSLLLRHLSEKNPLSSSKKRLRIIESLAIDSRRKAVLLKRDDQEHLLILGANSETLVESGIESKQDAEIVPLKSANETHET